MKDALKPYDISVTARVRPTVDVPLSQPWSSDVTFAEVESTARRQAIDDLERVMPGAQIVGVPEVTAISTRRAR